MDLQSNILTGALFDLAENFRKFQKGRYFYFKFSKCFQLFFQPDIQGSVSLRYPAFLFSKRATNSFGGNYEKFRKAAGSHDSSELSAGNKTRPETYG